MRAVSSLVGIVLAAVVGLVGLAAPAAAGDEMADALMAIEKSLWQGWADADGAPFESHLTDGAVVITPGGVTVGKAANIADITSGACEVASWELSSPSVHKVTDDVVVLTYEAEQDATCDGQEIPGHVTVSSLYVKADGAWKNAHYQETVIFEPMDE